MSSLTLVTTLMTLRTDVACASETMTAAQHRGSLEDGMPGRKYASIKNPRMYRKMRKHGMTKSQAAARSNAYANGTLNRKGG